MTFGRTLAAAVLWYGLGSLALMGSAPHRRRIYPDQTIKLIVPFVPAAPVDAPRASSPSTSRPGSART